LTQSNDPSGDAPVEVLVMRAYADPSVLAPLRAFEPRARVRYLPYAGARSTLSRAHAGGFVEASPVTAELREALARAECILALDVPPAIRALAPHLRWLHTTSAGVDHLAESGLIGSGVTVTNNRGLAAEPIAEYVLMGVLAFAKRLPEILEGQRVHQWRMLVNRPLSALTIGIVGLGAIGSEVARLAKGFGMRVLAVRRDFRPDAPLPPHVDRLSPPEALHDMLAESDFAVICVPLLPDTRGLMGSGALGAMQPTAVLINVARGAVVDEGALAAALRQGRLGGALLDTFDQEPLSPDSPLWDLPNTIISPHTSAYQPNGPERGVALFCRNLERYLAGEPLLNLVDPTKGY
jgi:phosphoglycerate dehydrogenase-like enzyme